MLNITQFLYMLSLASAVNLDPMNIGGVMAHTYKFSLKEFNSTQLSAGKTTSLFWCCFKYAFGYLVYIVSNLLSINTTGSDWILSLITLSVFMLQSSLPNSILVYMGLNSSAKYRNGRENLATNVYLRVIVAYHTAISLRAHTVLTLKFST
jgi:hypothetical protein